MQVTSLLYVLYFWRFSGEFVLFVVYVMTQETFIVWYSDYPIIIYIYMGPFVKARMFTPTAIKP